MSRRAGRRRRPVARSTMAMALTVALTLAGVGFLLLWGQATTPAPAPSAVPDVAARRTTPGPVETAVPVAAATRQAMRLSIPAIDVATDLIGLGLQDDGTVEVPTRPERAGWYRLGPRPGAQGSAVVLGHVDSVDGPAVFARLATLEPGDRVRVRHPDGTEVAFRVRSVTTYANADFPAELVYSPHGRRELNLVTCGGDYDAALGGYQANVVVNAVRA